ncbi:recombinase family protein [Streptomyces sp. NPDC058257]|uniref:recombinase family protein n=1 Tax=Streptomyces sp. NPDC058257 TaxID=3346409 RepID=UPI0036E13A14
MVTDVANRNKISRKNEIKIRAWSRAQLGKEALRGVIYVRVSMGRQKMESPEIQVSTGKAAAQIRGVELVGPEVIYDVDESGRSFHERKVMEIIEMIRRGEINCIIVLETSRWGRNLEESRAHVRELYGAGGVLISATQPIDPTTADGLMIMNHFMNMDEHASMKIGEGWARAAENRHDRHRPHFGRPVLGYGRCPDCRRSETNERSYEHCKTCLGIHQPDEKVAKHYAEAYKQYVKGVNFPTLAKQLAAKGVRSIYGNRISATSLKQSMDSGFAAGLIRIDAYEAEGRGPWDWMSWKRGAHKRIISLGTWMRYVQRRRKQSKPDTRTSTPKYSVSSLMRCGNYREKPQKDGTKKLTRCLASMGATFSGKPPAVTFRCSCENQTGECEGVTIRLSMAEKQIVKWVTARAKGEEQAALAMQRQTRVNVDAEALKEAEAQKKKLKGELLTLADALLDGVLSREAVKKRTEEKQADLRVVEQRLLILRDSVSSNSVPPKEAFQGFLKVWDRMTHEERRRALGVIIDHIVIVKTPGKQRNRLEIVPKWAPASEKLVPGRRVDWDRIIDEQTPVVAAA